MEPVRSAIERFERLRGDSGPARALAGRRSVRLSYGGIRAKLYSEGYYIVIIAVGQIETTCINRQVAFCIAKGGEIWYTILSSHGEHKSLDYFP